MSIEKNEFAPQITSYESDVFPSGISIVVYKYDGIETEGVPVLLLPGIRNPKDCEYDETQLKALLDNGASEIKYLRYSYTEPLSVDDVLIVINTILDSVDVLKLVGTSIGADLIAKFISLDGENNEKILDALLISLYSVARRDVFVPSAIAEKLIRYATSDTPAMKKLYSLISNGAEAPDMFITNCKRLGELREDLLFDVSSLKHRVPHIKVSWTKDREYSNEEMQRDIERQVSYLANSFEAETDLEGPHGVLKREESLPVYRKIFGEWCKSVV
jgi:hypothetical protein